MLKYLVVAVFILLQYSCTKEEGVGGLASIQGSIKLQPINCLLNESGSGYPAMDKDVFIQYGDKIYVGDKMDSSPSGHFQFNFLTPGNYKIFTYSDDNLNFDSKREIVIEKEVTISSNKEIVDIGELLTYKHVDIDEGTVSVSGFVKRLQYANGTTIVIDTILAQNTDVFLLFNGSNSCFLKEETLYDGSFSFNNLIPGDYKLYVLSEQAFTKEDIPIFVDFTIYYDTPEIVLETILISDF